jgi:hypothetical protein
MERDTNSDACLQFSKTCCLKKLTRACILLIGVTTVFMGFISIGNLHRRTLHRTVTAKHTAIAIFWLE